MWIAQDWALGALTRAIRLVEYQRGIEYMQVRQLFVIIIVR
ncbi:Uncharacterised protein [Mycobacteroides abscessus subsp. massiliense]|nr:Uncharacterised protein [Mycobacteroides abscessus subsp. massiliense]SKM27965.1 Uncharacterised protein [Mycobacteroides abscessus subsp. massiliense]